MGLKVYRWTQEELIWVGNGKGVLKLKFKGRIHTSQLKC